MYAAPKFTHIPAETKVALLAGGNSGERPISLKSAEGALGALTEAGYEVDQLDTAERDDLVKLIDGEYDVAFLCLHGKGGEDGSIQGFCQTIGLPYTHPGIFTSAAAIDKAKAKILYNATGVPTAKSITVTRENTPTAQEVIAELGEKVVVKAATEGSSIGVYITDNVADLAQALKDALTLDTKAVVEQFVDGRELTCVVLGKGADAQALPVIEIIPKNESYDFESKYAPGGCTHACPAELDDDVTARVQELAVLAHNALDGEGVSRTDFLVEKDGSLWALETNTVPGMTAASLLPDAAKAAGISFPELCKILVQYAIDDHSPVVNSATDERTVGVLD